MANAQEFSTIFVHIPKTAGTSLRAIIERVYDGNETCLIYPGHIKHFEMEEFVRLPDARKRNINMFCGHINFGLHEHIPQPCRYITILRDPVELIKSLFNHVLQEENAQTDKLVANFQKRFKNEKLTLQDYVARGITHDTDNKQTRNVSGEYPPFGHCTRNMLETAKCNLRKHFVVAGLTERFDESVMVMHKTLGWPLPFYIKQNISKNKAAQEELSPETLAVIRSHTELDAELYAFAQNMLDEQIESLGPSFQKELEDFKLANRLAKDLLENEGTKHLLQQQIDDLKNSWSWRVTAPMRKTFEVIKRWK